MCDISSTNLDIHFNMVHYKIRFKQQHTFRERYIFESLIYTRQNLTYTHLCTCVHILGEGGITCEIVQFFFLNEYLQQFRNKRYVNEKEFSYYVGIK